ncbi:AAA family ATPase [Bacillus sp. S/N-304-OC-R1]|uniref:AAA family ATPase n=1 Tax=Bacillus sp. S/N-304-OC-R1 TaxID=2758034 RepID=UPI001C8EA709|nr:AAA family ATPase [Bacillus sp. S/N-304-OC-R1]MBY0123085.1 AAA family ATPase [Bacillus sp. S/N-304-OC-R1]
MKIVALHIYGYGKLYNYKMTNLNDFQVLFGENEAGKSTIMSFIHSVLFGFPTKQQTELRYEPKDGTKYGGQLTAIFPEKGRALIERVFKGKATGDVNVILEDGTKGGEDLLKNLLNHVDKALFQSIFSFNIHGLQNIHQMKGEEIGRYLFSAGALGTDKLVQAENVLQREMDSRFKPSGKKPIINEKLKELKQLHTELNKAAGQNEQYWVLLEEKASIEKEIEEKQKEQAYLQQLKVKLEEWRKIKPLKLEEKGLIDELNQFDDFVFPVDGLTRLERLEDTLKPLEGQISSLQKRIHLIKEEISQNTPNMYLLNREHEIIAAVEDLSLLENLNQEDKELQHKLLQIEQEELILREKLHLSIEEEQVNSINTSIFLKEEIINAQDKYRRLQTKKLDLDDRFNEDKKMLEEIEDSIKDLEQQLLPEKERLRLEDVLCMNLGIKELEKEAEQIEERLERLYRSQKQQKQNSRSRKAQERTQFTMISLLFAAVMGWGIIELSWPIIVIGGLGIIVSIYLFLKRSAKSDQDILKQEIIDLEEKKQILVQKIKDPENDKYVKIEESLQKNKEILEQLHHLKIKWNERNNQYEKVLLNFESWEREFVKEEKTLIEIGGKLFLPKAVALAHLLDAFDLIEQLKKLFREKRIIAERHSLIKERLQKIIQAFELFNHEFLGNMQLSIQEIAYKLKGLLKEETEKKMMLDGKVAKVADLEEECHQYELEIKHFELEKKMLFQLAGVYDEEKFRELGKLGEKKLELQEKLNILQRQLNMSSINEEEIKGFETIINLEDLISTHTEKLESLKKTLPACQSLLAEKKYEVHILEEGGTYTELLHVFKQKKAELELEAKEWSRFAIAQDILNQTIERFKNERLPRLLKKAEEYLHLLTDGNYIRIFPKNEGSGFHIQSRDQILFEANELSQATAEQVYVAIRLALAVTVYDKFPFPIIIDDSFVNFDQKRTNKVISLLKSIKGRQIFFLTCHQHLLPHFTEEQIISVANTEKITLI